MDLKALEDAFDIREVLDGYAARQATALIGEADKERLRAIIRRCDAMANADIRSMDDLAEELQLGLQLHRIIAEVTGNVLPYDILSKLLDKLQHFIWIELLWLDEWDVARKEHAEIVEAICCGEGERAAALASRHVRGSRNNILRLLKARTAHRAALARVS